MKMAQQFWPMYIANITIRKSEREVMLKINKICVLAQCCL